MPKKIVVLPGDGIGPEIVAEAEKVLRKVDAKRNIGLSIEHDLIGGQAIDHYGVPFHADTLKRCKNADAILMGSVGGPKWDAIPPSNRPERGLLKIRYEMELFANLRPAILYPQLAAASSLKPALVAGLDIVIVRELTGGIYFGEPRGIRILEGGERQGYNTYVYSESEVERIGRVAFSMAQKRKASGGKGKLCSVDKANVLEATVLWREVMQRLSTEYPDIELTHMYVDNAAMQLVRAPKQFDVIVTGNMFGDILSDTAAMLTGSIGMLPSASLDKNNKGLYEPVHGSAPDIAGKGCANPLATILSAAMMLRYSLDQADAADDIERAVGAVLDDGLRSQDIHSPGCNLVSTAEMGQAVADAI